MKILHRFHFWVLKFYYVSWIGFIDCSNLGGGGGGDVIRLRGDKCGCSHFPHIGV